jgi:hypothetical protein
MALTETIPRIANLFARGLINKRPADETLLIDALKAVGDGSASAYQAGSATRRFVLPAAGLGALGYGAYQFLNQDDDNPEQIAQVSATQSLAQSNTSTPLPGQVGYAVPPQAVPPGYYRQSPGAPAPYPTAQYQPRQRYY